MTYDEVCATVAAPPGTYSDRVVPLLGVAHAGWTYDRRRTAHDGGMLVTFRERDDTVELVFVADSLPDHRPFVQRGFKIKELCVDKGCGCDCRTSA
jgi:hypothetical protein